MKLADEPLAPKKKSKSKVKLAAKAKKAKKRGAIGTADLAEAHTGTREGDAIFVRVRHIRSAEPGVRHPQP